MKIINIKHIKKVVFMIIIACIFCASVIIANASCCDNTKGNCAGRTSCPRSIQCWVDDMNTYCGGHNFGALTYGTASQTYGSKNYYNDRHDYYTHENYSEGTTSATRTEVDHRLHDYSQTIYISRPYSMTCSICNYTFSGTEETTSTSTGTEAYTTTKTEKRSRVAVTVQHQDTNGAFHTTNGQYKLTDGTSAGDRNYNNIVSNWTGWSNCDEGGDQTNPASVSLSWSLGQTYTHHSSNTHGSDDANISNATANRGDDGVHYTRKIYRKRYWTVFYSNPQTKISTGIEYIRPDGSDYRQMRRTLSGSEKTYTRLCYVDENWNVPRTYDLFQQYGYYSHNQWFDARANGNDKGCGYRNWIQGLNGYNDPDVLFVYNVYANWISEPGKLFLMPNSQFDGGTDSCYGAYIDDVTDNKATENVYLFDSKQ